MDYFYPKVLVSTKWINDHLGDPQIRIMEVDYNPATSYMLGHIPGAILFDWKKDLIDSNMREIISKESFEKSLQRSGVNNDTILIVYGDYKNWFATFAFWILKYYGFQDVRLMNGSRKKWLEEERPISLEVPSYPLGSFKASGPDKSIRVFMDYVKKTIGSHNKILIDVRSNEEYQGKTLAPSEYFAEYGQIGGHIPGAVNVPWNYMINDDGNFQICRRVKEGL